MKEIWRVDVSTGRISHQPVPEEYRLLGGRGLTSRMIADEASPISEPLGTANKLVLAPGLPRGTVAPSAGRLSAGAKSPLTGGIKEDNGGGLAGHKLARLGIKALVFEGGSAKTEWQYLLITDGGQELQRLLEERGGKHGHPCHAGCPIRCSNVYIDKQGQYVTSGLEYETIGLLGANCGVGNLDAIAQLDRFCDDFGLDTMELGDTVAVCMEAGLLPFGDIQGIWHLIDEIRADSTLGKVLGQGTVVAGKVLGVCRIPAVKGQGISSYDPRGLKGTGVTYATSPVGADHTAGNCLPGRGGFRPSTRGGANPHQGEGQAELSKDIQILTTVCDITGQCFFVGANEEMLDYATRLLNAGYGLNLSQEDVPNLSRKTLRTEIKFNEKAGLTTASNRLSEFFSTEELPPFNLTFDIPQNELENFWVDL